MKEKVPSHIFPVFGSILSLFILVFCTACASFDSYLETALNFYDVHQTELQAAQAALQASTHSASVASGLPQRRFSRMLPENRVFF